MSQLELAWAAGFIDGEGTFGLQRQKGRKSLPYLQAGQVDRRVLDRLCAAVGSGKVYGPYKSRRENERPYHYFRLTGQEKTLIAAEQLWPWLSEVKKVQFWKVTGMDEDTALKAAGANNPPEFDSLTFRS